jgi:predicted phage terminase large subunit-like protein
LYPATGGTGFPGRGLWRWPNGFTVGFRHLEDDSSITALQGAQIPFIGFDELTHFTRDQFVYLMSRNRSMTGIPGRIRATCNADSSSWVKDFVRWWLDERGQYPDPAKTGKLRWMVRDGDEFVWYDTREEAEKQHGDQTANSVTFIPARVTDNEPLMAADPAYLTRLRALGHVLRQQLEFGDWLIRSTAGMVFRREWFRIVQASIREGLCIRYWDRAATPAGAGDSETEGPDWTVGVKMRMTPQKQYVIEDVRRLRGTPSEVELAIKNTAEQDGKEVIVGIEQDPGQAGKAEAGYHVRQLAGWNVRTFPVSKAKLVRATPFSAQCEAGNVMLVEAPWNDPYLRVLEAFPDGPKDDDVDASSGAFNALTTGIRRVLLA